MIARDHLPPELATALARARGRLGRLATTVAFFPTVGSTNDVAASLADEGAVVIADEQTAGRGRRGHSWFSPAGSGLYVSVVLAPARAAFAPTRATQLLTIAAGVALAEAMDPSTGLRVDLKWPNDLHAGGRKLAGILAEASAGGSANRFVILGYGINVGPMACPPDLRDRVTSLEAALGHAVDRYQLLVETLAAIARRYQDLLDGRFDVILDAWRRRAPASRGAPVSWTDACGQHSGITAGVDDEGALLVRVGDRMKRIVGGEVTWL
jgi:BirA family biotin operon repressor/biotin-[acetyl-CoA-carboxylase] ligase